MLGSIDVWPEPVAHMIQDAATDCFRDMRLFRRCQYRGERGGRVTRNHRQSVAADLRSDERPDWISSNGQVTAIQRQRPGFGIRHRSDIGLAGFGERPQKYLYRNYARGLGNQPLSMYNDMLS